jgi:molybdopterin/thiamine biosynthesis adenylyltransferase
MKKDNLKIAVIGLNGIGSYFVRGLSELIKKDISGLDRINVMGIDLFDDDIIEEKNLSYTIYDIEHIGRKKAEVLSEITGYKARAEKIVKIEQLADYDLVILAVDNNEVRNLVYQAGRPFIDLRAKGKGIMAYLTKKEDTEYLE